MMNNDKLVLVYEHLIVTSRNVSKLRYESYDMSIIRPVQARKKVNDGFDNQTEILEMRFK